MQLRVLLLLRDVLYTGTPNGVGVIILVLLEYREGNKD